MDNVNAATHTGATASTNAPAQAKPAKKLEVDDFLITGAKVHVSLTDMGGKEMTLPLPPIHLTDLGKNADGITPAELTRSVLDAIVAATVKEVSKAGTEVGKNAESLIENTGKSAGGGLSNVTKGIRHLFGK
jgi:hypothetical protein